jgi:peroxiredoxin
MKKGSVMSKKIVTALWTACCLICLSSGVQAYEIGDVVENFTLTDLSGQSVSLSDLEGQIIVLNFFTTWCPGCNEEAGHLENEVWLAYTDLGVSVIAIDIQEPLSLVQGWAAAMEITYPVWMAPDWDLFQLFPGAIALPYNAILDADHVIRYGAMGFDLTAITNMLGILIDESQVPVSAESLNSVKAMFHH